MSADHPARWRKMARHLIRGLTPAAVALAGYELLAGLGLGVLDPSPFYTVAVAASTLLDGAIAGLAVGGVLLLHAALRVVPADFGPPPFPGDGLRLALWAVSLTLVALLTQRLAGRVGRNPGRSLEPDSDAERWRVEARLRESQHVTHTAISSANAGMVIYDRDLRCLVWNKFMEAMTGMPADRVVGLDALAPFPNLREQGVDELIRRALAGETVVSPDIEYRNSSTGRTGWVVSTYFPHVSGEGETIGVVGMVRDITTRKRRQRELQAIVDTTRDVIGQQDPGVLLEIIVDRAVSMLGVTEGGVYLYHAETGELEPKVQREPHEPLGVRLKLGEGLSGQVALTRQALIVDDYARWPGRSEKFEGIPCGACIGVPMIYGGELVGVLELGESQNTARRFTDADARLLSLFAAHAAGAVRSAHLFDETRQRLAELEAVQRLSTALRAAETLDEMLPSLLDETLAVMAAGAGIIWLYDDEREMICEAASRGWFTGIVEPSIRPDEGIAGHVFATGETHVSREFAADPLTRDSTRMQIPVCWGGACVPIRTLDRVVGVLFVSVQLPREVTPGEVRLLSTLAEIAGNAIHRARLNAKTEQRLRHLAGLRSIDEAITASLDLRVTLNVLLEQVTLQLRVHASAILLLNPYTQILECAASRGFQGNGILRTRLRLGEGLAGRAALERRPVHVGKLTAAGSVYSRESHLSGEGFHSYYAVPLVAKGLVKGILEVFHRSALEPDHEWVDFLRTMAGQAAIAIDNATLFNDLQRSNAELTLAYDSTLEGWARALDLRDAGTLGHTQRVIDLTLRLARAVGLGEQEVVHVRRGILLHDLGHMGVPEHILLKPGPLTGEEWEIMRRHPAYAHEMLSPIGYLRPALDIPYCHHERWDGTGYPRGLRGEQIPLAARAFAVADVWDALLSDRPYRRGWTREAARQYVHDHAGTQFDPRMVEAFLAIEAES